MKNIIFIALFFCSQNHLLSQKGFLNARNSVSISAFGNIPLLSGSFSDPSYEIRGDEMKGVKDWFDYGFQFKYVAGVKRNFGIGIVASINNFQVNPEQRFGLNYKRSNVVLVDTFSLKIEDVGLNKFSFMPVFEFYHKNGLSPIGLYHTIGFGYSYAKVQNGFYAFSVSKAPISDINPIESAEMTTPDYYELEQDWKPFQFIEFMFGIGMKTPLSKRIAIDFGVNYNVNIAFKPSNESLNEKGNGVFDYSNIYYNVRREKLGTIVANLGIVFLF